MKSLILAAAIMVLAFAGVATAQNRGAGVTDGADWPHMPAPARVPPNSLGPYVDSHQKVAWAVASDNFRLACAADRAALCADKASERAALRCVNYHRLRLSSPCKQALIELRSALSGG